MKKTVIAFTLLGLFSGAVQALEIVPYGKFYTGAWWMHKHTWYWEEHTVINNDGSVDTVMEDPGPSTISDFLTGGGLGITAKGERFKGCVEIGIANNLYDFAGEGPRLISYNKYNYALYLKKWFLELFLNDYISVMGGQDYALTCFSSSEQGFYGYNSFSNVGCLYTGRNPMVKFTVAHPDKIWGINLAVIKIDTVNLVIDNKLLDIVNGEEIIYKNEIRIPKLEGSFGWDIGGGDIFGFSGKLVGGFQRFYQIGVHDKQLGELKKFPVNSFVTGAELKVKLGPVNTNVAVFGGYNVGTYGAFVGDVFGWWFDDKYSLILYPIILDKVYNSKIIEVALINNIKPTERLIFELGAGTVLGNHTAKEYKEIWHPTLAWYFLGGYKFFDMLRIEPEIGQYWYGPKEGFGRYTYWGLKSYVEF